VRGVGTLPGVPLVEELPGDRDALRGGAEPHRDLPARARRPVPHSALPGDEQAPPPASDRRSATASRWAWTVLFVALAVAVAALRTLDGPTLLQQSLAAAMGVTLAVGLAVRSGGRASFAAVLAGIVAVAAVATQWEALLGGAAVAIGVLAACLAVLATRPAATLPAVLLEVVLALVVATAGGLGVAGLEASVDTERFAYTVLVLAIVSTVAMVYRLGGGVHGLGGRGLILAAGALVLLVVVLVYTAALTRYGSPELVMRVADAEDWTRDHLGGVPHPVEVLVGIPALAWGVSMRSRRRQGWWVIAFGTAATAAAASKLAEQDLTTRGTSLSAVYSIVLGLVLGCIVIRLERLLSGRDGRRTARRTAQEAAAAAARHEPGRLQPLH
jgi:hypothetical protein